MIGHHSLRICIKSGGDLATGVAMRLFRAGLRQLLLLETPSPLAVRRRVAFSEAVHHGAATVEGITCHRIRQVEEAEAVWEQGNIALLVDPVAACVARLQPHVLVDAIVAKRNVGTSLLDAPLTIALGPGFTAGRDVHAVIETHRGHRLGRVLHHGQAAPNTGIPGDISGQTTERLLRAPTGGVFTTSLDIGRMVRAGDVVGAVDGQPVVAQTGGVLRGVLRDQTPVHAGCKVGDVDPRGELAACEEVSDKALAVGGGVLEAILGWHSRQGLALPPHAKKESVWPSANQ